MNIMLTILLAPFYVAWFVAAWIIENGKALWQFWYRWLAGRKKVATHGNAAWADKKQLKKNGHFRREGWMVGSVDGKPIYTGLERNVLLCTNPGQGKTMSLVAALKAVADNSDILVNDPAGDIERHTRADFEAKGYRTLCFNLVEPHKSDMRWNPLASLNHADTFNFEREVDVMADLIMPDDAHSRDEHFQRFARMMLAAAIEIGVTEDIPLNLGEIVEILAVPSQLRMFFEGRLKGNASINIKQAYHAYANAGDKERGSFNTTLARKLKPWGTNTMRQLLQDDPFAPWVFSDIYRDDRPSIIYIKAGLGNPETAGVARLMLGDAINARRRLWNAGERLKRPMRLLVDEALTIGNCVPIQDAVNELRKAKVTCWMTYLSLQSVRDTLSHAENIINACELIVFGGGRDMKLYKEVSDLMGDKTIESASRSESEHGESKGLSEQARRLIKPDELRMLPYEEQAMTLGVLNVKCRKTFTRHGEKVTFQSP